MTRKITRRCRIRIIASDIDETFVTSEKKMLPENLAAVAEARRSGVEFAFATGRYWPALKDVASSMGLCAPQILDNGAVILSAATEEVLSSVPLELEPLRFFWNGLAEAGFVPTIGNGKEYFVSRMEDAVQAQFDSHAEKAAIVSEEEIWSKVRQGGFVKLFTFGAHRADELNLLTDRLIAEARQAGMRFSSVYTERGIFVVTDAQVNKGTGLERLCKAFGCSIDEVAAVGDGENDVEMLATAGRSFAVANAVPRARESATDIVPSNNEAGFAVAVREVLKANASFA